MQDYKYAQLISAYSYSAVERKIAPLQLAIFKDWGNPDLDPVYREQVNAYIAGLTPEEFSQLMNNAVLTPWDEKEILRTLLLLQTREPRASIWTQKVLNSIKFKKYI